MRGRASQARRTRAKHAPIAHEWPPIGQHTHKIRKHPPHPTLWQVGGRRRQLGHDQKVDHPSEWRALGGRLFGEALVERDAGGILQAGPPPEFEPSL